MSTMSSQSDLEKALTVGSANSVALTRCNSDLSEGRTPGQWAKNEVQVLPKNKLFFVIPGLMCAVFLNTLDLAIVATAMPEIVRELGGSQAYSWVGAVYLMVTASLIPLYGRLGDIVGRKPLILSSIAIFLAGSALCGAAQNFIWLVIARGVQGVGFSGTFTLSQIIVADITTLEQRALYSSALSVVWAIGSLAGPILGGILTEHVNWRWVFYLNLPVGALSMLLLAIFLNLNPLEPKSAIQHLRDFDFLGQFLLMSCISCILLGFQFSSENGWTAPITLSLLIVGFLLLIGTAANIYYTTRSPIFPRRLFTTRTTVAILISVFIHQLPFLSILYYLPIYFQSRGDSPTLSGLELLSFPVGAALVAIAQGIVVNKTKRYREVIWFSWVTMTIGVGVMIMLDENSSLAFQQGSLILTAVGLGGLFQPPIIALQAAMPLKDVPTATAALGLVRVIGGVFSLSIGGVVYQSERSKMMTGIPGYEPQGDISSLVSIQPPELRQQVIHAYAKSVSSIWIVFAPLCFFGMLCVFFIRPYSLERTVIRAPDTADPNLPNNNSENTVTASSSSQVTEKV